MLITTPVSAAVSSVTPITWNIIGLDSNTPSAGPNRFPVGAKVCSDSAGTIPVTFTWDSANPYIDLRAGSLGTPGNPLNLAFSGAGCKDAFFEVEVSPTALAFDTTRRYHISAGSLSTPTPREVYVERLVSQGRNAITNMEYGTSLASMQSVAAGGSMNLVKDNIYYIRMSSYTATSGYSQLENFVNFSNTVFQVLSVSSTFTADTSSHVSSPSDKLYQDACLWENDPNSPNYRSCSDSGNAGGTMTVTYQIKIISVGSGMESLNSLVHDFSGSSFHYNSDYSTTARFAYLIDPALVTISKNFAPDPTNVNGVSTLTFTITNPNSGTVSNVNFTDTFPTSPGALVVDTTPNAQTNGCGTPTFSPPAGSASISFSNGTIAGHSSCTVSVNVTPPATGTYNNTSGHLYLDTIDTGNYAADSLTVNTEPPLPSPVCGIVLAKWTFPAGFSTASPAPSTAIVTATASPGPGIASAEGNATSTADATKSWISNGSIATGTPLATTNNDYFEFAVNTTGYSPVYLNFNAQRKVNNSPQGIAVYTGSAAGNPETGTSIYNNSTVLAANTTWYAFGAGNSLPLSPVGSGTTYARIYAFNSGNTNPGSDVYIDDMTFTACGVPNPPTITKSFSPNPVAVNAASTLTFTVTNPNAGVALTGVSFSDTLPLDNLQGTASVNNGSPIVTGTGTAFKTQLVAGSIISISGVTYTVSSIASDTSLTLTSNYSGATASGLTLKAGLTVTSGSSSQCGGTLTRTAPNLLSFSGGTIAAGGSCTITATVTAGSAGPHTNVSGFVSSTEGGTNTEPTGTASATLTAVLPPSISKQFAPNPILAGWSSTLTFVITNPNQNNALNAVAFSDTFPVSPGAMTVASPLTTSSTCGGSLLDNLGGALAAGDAGISLTGGSLAAGGSCTVTVLVTVPVGVTGTYNNTSGTVSHTINAATVNGNTASASLTVNPAYPSITMLKQVGTTATGPWTSFVAVATGASVYFKFSVENTGDVDLTSVSVSDPAAYINIASCSWTDGDGGALTSPFTLNAPSPSNNKHIATCVLGPVAASAGSHTNTATATGTYSSNTYTDTSSATYATTSLSIVKNATESYFKAAGDILHYSYLVTNSGFATLSGPVTVADDKSTDESCPALTTIGDNDNFFDPSESITCTATYAVTSGDVTAKSITNTASATATGSGVSSGTDSKTLYLAADLSAIKKNDISTPLVSGGTFHWTITVSNAATAGTVAFFADTQNILKDELPTSGATYAVGIVVTSGITGTGSISCSESSNVLTCSASGGTVSFPTGLTGTISVNNGSNALTGSGTSFTTQLSAGSIILISGVPYTVSSVTNDTNLVLTTNYSGATASGLSIPSSFSVPVTVTTTAAGTLVNPTSGGVCKADPDTLIPEIGEANNECADTVMVYGLPNISILKSANGAASTNAAPGSVVTYEVQLLNTGGPGTSVVLQDDMSPYTTFCLNCYAGAAFSFTDGPAYGFPASGLTLGTPDYSQNNGITWGYTLVDGGCGASAGYDGCVTNWKMPMTGTINGGGGFKIHYQVKVK